MLGATTDRRLGEERLLDVKFLRKVANKDITLDVRMNSYGIVLFTSFSRQEFWSERYNSALLPYHLHSMGDPSARN